MSAFSYIYRTSQGDRLEATIEAASRDDAFATLRAQGIRPIKVVAMDGSKANGAGRGAAHWWQHILVPTTVALAIIATFISAIFMTGRKALPLEVKLSQEIKPPELATFAQPLVRQAIPGDRYRIDSAIKDLFQNPVEAMLARFAEPGRPFSMPETLPSEKNVRDCLATAIRVSQSELSEEIDLKRIVTWMKREMRGYLSAGYTFEEYVERLKERQRQEITHRCTAESRLAELLEQNDHRKAYAYWLKSNAQLQSMGIYPMPLPDTLRNYQSNVTFDE